MKRKVFILMMAVLLVLLLTGCACSHEWTAADCEHAAVCTKCDEIGEAALGHDWVPASCAQPETCSRCELTRGEALAHSFGDWGIGEKEMTRSCTVCAAQESSEINRELAVQQLLPGNWDYHSAWYNTVEGGMAMSAYDIPIYALPYGLWIRDDGSFAFYNAAMVFEGLWKYRAFEEHEESVSYICDMEMDGQILFSVRLIVPNDGSENQVMFHASDSYVFMMRNDQLESLLEGCTLKDVNSDNYVSFGPERVATGSFGDAFTGTWILKPVGQRYEGGNHLEVSIRVNDTYFVTFQFSLFDDSIPSLEELKRADVLVIDNNGTDLGSYEISYSGTVK